MSSAVRSCYRLPSSPTPGFTLVEVMVVIVILSLFAAMMTFSVSSGDSRRQMAFYEQVKSQLGYVRLLSLESMQPYGIAIKLAQADQPNQLVVVKLDPPTAQPGFVTTATPEPPVWQLEPQATPIEVPKGVEVTIHPLQADAALTTAPNWLVGNQAPPVVWFGTGEATPVQISISVKNNDGNRFAVGDPLVINSAGAIDTTANMAPRVSP